MTLHPVVLEHAGQFVGRTPWEVSHDAELLFRAHCAAWQFYGHAPVVCGIDVYNLEAEAWGAGVEHPQGHGVPTLAPPIFSNVKDLLQCPDLNIHKDGRLPLTLEAARHLKEAGADVRVPMAGPVSIAAGLLGFEPLLIAMLEEPDQVRDVLSALADRQGRLAEQWLEEGMAPILYESGGGPPLVSPGAFRRMVAPALGKVFTAVPMPCILGGNTASIAKDLLSTGLTATICPAETDQVAFMEQAARRPQISVRLNLPASALADGDWNKAMAALERVAALAHAHPHASVGTGVLPYHADRNFVRRLMTHMETGEKE